MNKEKQRPGLFPGWWMVIASGIISGLGSGFIIHGFSALFKPISLELGFSRAATSVAMAIRSIEFAVMAPVIGWLFDRFGPRGLIGIGLALMGVGMIFMNYIHSLWAYYLVWGAIIGAGSPFALTITADAALTNWFVKKRGRAFGIRFALIGIIGAAVVPLITFLLQIYGWRITCVIWACVMFALLPLVIFAFKKKRPEYYGYLPDGTKLESNNEMDEYTMADKGPAYDKDFQETDFTLKQALKTPVFWLLILAFDCGFLVQGGFGLHCIPFMTDMGIDPTVAGGMMGMMIFFMIPSRFFCGLIADGIGKDRLRFLMAGAILLMALGLATFLLRPTLSMVYVLLTLYGIGGGPTRPLLMIMRSRYFGRKAYGAIEGTALLFEFPITLLAPVYAGWIHDTTGNYRSAFTLFALLAAVAAFLMCFVRPPKPPLK
ncbi:MAG: MFS transporter [Deltaproteobacteria bacterium]|nr:MFS transporter [Deltaproteobacteria bacterium]